MALGTSEASRPVKVALVIKVGLLRMKSSAVSVWIPAPLGGRESVASLPSGLPVLKENVSATTGKLAAPKHTMSKDTERRKPHFARNFSLFILAPSEAIIW